MPFDIDVATPADDMLIALFPANERTNRNTIQSIITAEHYEGDGKHKIAFGTTAGRPPSPAVGNLYYDTTVGQLCICLSAGIWTAIGTAGLTVGTIRLVAYPYGTPEALWLPCDGASLLRATYAALFAKIGTRFGSVDGTHFNVPDLGGATPAGMKVGGDVDGEYADTGPRYGAKKATLAVANMPAHAHPGSAVGAVTGAAAMATYDDGSASHIHKAGTTTSTTSSDIPPHTHALTIASQGSGTPFDVRNELVVGFLIYAGV